MNNGETRRFVLHQELKWLSSVTWENIWGRNWGLCLAKLLGRTKQMAKPGAGAQDRLAVVDETKCVELDPATL